MAAPGKQSSSERDREEYEQDYVRGDTPWDSGVPSAELVRVLDAGSLPGKTVLELGCGTGTNSIELARRGYRVTGVDFSSSAAKRAREKVRKSGLPIEIREGDILTLDLGGPYDVLFDRGVYHGIRTVDLPGFLAALKRVTRRGTRWLCIAGNAKEPSRNGPPVVHEREFRAELGPLFRFLEVREFRLTLNRTEFRPLAWSILMERK
jgi:methyl halide transferase